MGYVPSGEVSEERPRDDVSGYQRRRDRARRADLSNLEVGRLGESIAAEFLARRGFKVLDRNVRIGRGEIDLLVFDGRSRVVVEVKTVVGRSPLLRPEEAFTAEKASTVRRLAAQLEPAVGRIDLVAITLTKRGAGIRWIRAAA